MDRMLKLQMKLQETGLFEIMSSFVPQQYIDVGWGDQETDAVALFGNQLSTSSCLEKPNCVFEAKDGVFYTIVCFDADRRDSKTGGYLHWVRCNVHGDTRFASGRDVWRWQSPHPAEGDSPHRLFFVVFHQTNGSLDLSKLPLISKNSKEARNDLNLTSLTERIGLGIVIGANCCRMAFDESVPKTLSSLKDKVELSQDGKTVLAEEANGERIEYKKMCA